MPPLAILVRPEPAELDQRIEKLNADVFGPGRFARTAYRLRESARHCPRLSFVALTETESGIELAGSVRLTRIAIGTTPALLLGPLVVDPTMKNAGVGRELMNRAVDAAARDGNRLIVLVGDLPYYAKFGFRQVPPGRIRMPGPVDPARLLYCELQPDAFHGVSGLVASNRDHI